MYLQSNHLNIPLKTANAKVEETAKAKAEVNHPQQNCSVTKAMVEKIVEHSDLDLEAKAMVHLEKHSKDCLVMAADKAKEKSEACRARVREVKVMEAMV